MCIVEDAPRIQLSSWVIAKVLGEVSALAEAH